MFPHPPNAYFAGPNLLFTDHRGRWSLTGGAELHGPNLEQALPAVLNRVNEALRALLRGLAPHLRMQCVLIGDANYGEELDRYCGETQRTANHAVAAHRKRRSDRYQERRRQGKLRRRRLFVFFSCRLAEDLPKALSRRALQRRYQAVLDAASHDLSLAFQTARDGLAAHGMAMVALGAPDYYLLYSRFLNPSQVDRPDCDPLALFDPSLSLHENCWHAEAVCTTDCIQMDGYYRLDMALDRWPQVTYPGIIHRLTQLPGLQFQITVNIECLSVAQQIKLAEKKRARLKAEYECEQKPSLLTVVKKIDTRVDHLMEGFLRPFSVQYFVSLWARSLPELVAASSAARQSINSMNGAQVFQPALPATRRKLFFQTWPGWLWSGDQAWKLYAEDAYLADMLPVLPSFTAYLSEAEALFDGPQDSVVGVKTVSKSGPDGAPQHAVMLGRSGGGKSVLLRELLIQTAPYYDLTVLIDNGLAHESLIPYLDPNTTPLILRPNGNLTLNYLDTQGLPLSADHIAQAAALTALMCGAEPNAAAEHLRRALLSKYIRQLYEDVFDEWSRRHPDLLQQTARLLCALIDAQPQHPDATLLESYVAFHEWAGRCPAEAMEGLQKFTEAQWVHVLKAPETRDQLRSLAFTHFAAAQYPTHRMLQELLQLEAARADRESARQLGLLLEPWCANGSHGPLFDGASNVSLGGPFVYIELGQLSAANIELRAVVGFLVQIWIWQRIFTMPRTQRKRLIIEEASAFLSLPGAPAIVQRLYEQSRKHSTQIFSVYQQFAALQSSDIRAAVLGNSHQFFLLSQSDREDLRQLAADLPLSQAAVDEILRYPKPELAGYSAFTYFHRDTPHSVCGTAYHKILPC